MHFYGIPANLDHFPKLKRKNRWKTQKIQLFFRQFAEIAQFDEFVRLLKKIFTQKFRAMADPRQDIILQSLIQLVRSVRICKEGVLNWKELTLIQTSLPKRIFCWKSSKSSRTKIDVSDHPHSTPLSPVWVTVTVGCALTLKRSRTKKKVSF